MFSTSQATKSVLNFSLNSLFSPYTMGRSHRNSLNTLNKWKFLLPLLKLFNIRVIGSRYFHSKKMNNYMNDMMPIALIKFCKLFLWSVRFMKIVLRTTIVISLLSTLKMKHILCLKNIKVQQFA